MSIKWKLSFALILSGLTLVSAFAYLAIATFEMDKISYVYDSQSARLESVRSELQGKIKFELAIARNVAANLDANSGKLSVIGEQFFNEEKTIGAVDLWNERHGQFVFQISKSGISVPAESSVDASQVPVGQIEIEGANDKTYVITARYEHGDQGILRLRALFDMTDLLPRASVSQSVALVKGSRILAVSDLRGIDKAVFNAIAGQSRGDERTQKFRHGTGTFLVTEVPVGIAGFTLIAITPESEALGALGTLFKRAVVFLVLSGCLLVAVSLLLARRLTRNLRVLTASAARIAAGNFDSLPEINTGDEMGILARAFSDMSHEIQRLLLETQEKARMEEELKTASLVQERLMPYPPTAVINQLEVSGVVITSSECGGDWWYYFRRGDDLYVAIADATGHGTPAALITATARSIFSRLENEDLTLGQMLRAWDFAVSSCSRREVFMTALLFRINTVTGQGAFVNAAHEGPFILRARENGTYKPEYLETDVSARLGDDIDPSVQEVSFELGVNESLVLYTDGLFSVQKDDGGALSEVRLGKKLATRVQPLETADGVNQAALAIFNEHRQDLPVPDDVSIVTIRRRAVGAMAISA